MLLATLLLCSVVSLFGQSYYGESDKQVSVDVGVLMGGGSLIGADLEVKPKVRLGVQVVCSWLELSS